MRGWMLGVLTSLVVMAVVASQSSATPIPEATPLACRPTDPNGVTPPNEPPSPGDYGNDVLWTTLTMWSSEPGIVRVPLQSLQPDGTALDLKWAWYRFTPGRLTIKGHRLDAPAPPLTAMVLDGYGLTGFQVTGMTFPSDGCWEVTGQVGVRSLSFVVQVVWPEGWTPEASPAASPAATPAD